MAEGMSEAGVSEAGGSESVFGGAGATIECGGVVPAGMLADGGGVVPVGGPTGMLAESGVGTPITSKRTGPVPGPSNPICLAAAFDRSMMRPSTNGPRSMTRTITVFPFSRYKSQIIG